MTVWKAPAPIPKNLQVNTIPAFIYEEYDSAIKNYWHMFYAEKVMKQRINDLKCRLIITPVKAVYLHSNIWHVEFETTLGTYKGIPGLSKSEKKYPHDSLNEHHYFENVHNKINGLREADVTRVDDYNLTFPESISDVTLALSNKGGVMLSHNKSLASRGTWTLELFDEMITKISKNKVTKFGYVDFWGDYANDTYEAGYSGNSGWFADAQVDDVEYYYKNILFLEKNVVLKLAKSIANLKDKEAKLKQAYKTAKAKPPAGLTTSGDNGPGQGPKKQPQGPAKTGDGKLVYNMPGVKDSYFTSGLSTTPGLVGREWSSPLLVGADGNRPANIQLASDLWSKVSGGNSKGLIQSFVKIGALSTGGHWRNPNAGTNSNLDVNLHTYGFQFLYNPSTVSMAFAGAPPVDIGLELSGADAIPLIGSSATSSTISFSLLLNRMQDMKYIDDILAGNLDAKEIYPWIPDGTIDPEITAESELKRIRNLGTMYDIEFLLQTLIGYRMKSILRGGTTSDIGYLGAYPVELHLGKKLRYLGTIDSINANHTIFTKDMIPVFTNLEVTFNRLPEYQNYQSNYATTGGVKK